MPDSISQGMEERAIRRAAGDNASYYNARALGPLQEDHQRLRLRASGTARCHILADSNVRIIVEEIYAALHRQYDDLKSVQQAHHFEVPENVLGFIRALTAEKGVEDILQWLLEDINGTSQAETSHSRALRSRTSGNVKQKDVNKRRVMDALSVGSGNLFFGDAYRNTIQLHGLDVPFEGNRPTQCAVNIIDAVLGLGFNSMAQTMTILNSLTPTMARADHTAISSSSTRTYPSEARFGQAHDSSMQSRSYSFSDYSNEMKDDDETKDDKS